MGDYVRAWRSGRVVCLAVSRTVSEGLLTVLDELECALTGQRKGPFWRRPRPLPDRRLFPDAYFDREAMFCAFAHAQAPYLSRPRWNARVDWPTVPLLRGGRELTWLVTCQTALAEAALTEPEESEDVQVSTA